MTKNLGYKWVLIIGGFGFLSGFVGPMILAPEANQGPLLGILITGPIGFMSGLFFWLLSAIFSWSYKTQIKIATAGCAAFIFALFAIAFYPEPEWPGRSYRISVTNCRSSMDGESILETTILQEKQFKKEKPLFREAYYTAGEITTRTPQHLSFYVAGSCADFPAGFEGLYYVDNHPQVHRDKAVLLPLPEHFQGL